MNYSFQLIARVLLYAPSHRQDSIYHGLWYTSRGTRNGSMTTTHYTMSKRSYNGARPTKHAPTDSVGQVLDVVLRQTEVGQTDQAANLRGQIVQLVLRHIQLGQFLEVPDLLKHNTNTSYIGCHRPGRERDVLFNDALNTFYLQLYDVRHMVKDHSDSEKGNPLPPHRERERKGERERSFI